MNYFCCIIFLSATFSSCITLAQEVNGKITDGKRVRYKLLYRPKINSDQKSTDYMNLIFDDKQSYFESGKKTGADSLKKTRYYQSANKNEQAQMTLRYHTEFAETIQVIPSKEKICYTTVILGSPTFNVQYEEKFRPIWKLYPEKMEIAGMKCAKATTTAYGRDWTAWYSLDLPVPYGPYKFYGLPGIIVKLIDAENDFDYEITEVHKGSYSYHIGTRFMDIQILDKSKVEELKNNQHARLTSVIRGAKVIGADGSEREYTDRFKRAIENSAKTKNHIELTLEP